MDDHLYEYDYHFDFNDKVNVNVNGNACSGPSSSMRYGINYRHSMYFQPVAAHGSPASSSTTSSSAMVDTVCCAPPAQENSLLFNLSKGLFAGDPVNASSSDEFMSENVKELGGHVASSAFATAENETTDEHDCEGEFLSQEIVEILADEDPPKPLASRNSKRSRAAEVHNLSEKRRRSRINEKMKALQNLIPNSNKTDKASMLDEAIEYLKQLQLQVQMLTLRNGFTFNSMGVPEPLQPIQLSEMRMSFGQENGSLHMNSTGALTLTKETPTQTVFSLPDQHCDPNRLPVPNMSNIVNSQTPFELDSSVQTHFRPFQPCTSSREMCKEDMLQSLQLNVNPSETNPSVLELGTADRVLFPFNTQAIGMKDNSSLETCLIGRDQEDVHLKNMERNILLPMHLTGMQAGSSVPGDNFNLERTRI